MCKAVVLFGMRTKHYYLLLLAAIILSSCSHDIYNNSSFLSSHDLNGKKLAILPVEVYYTGIAPSKGDIHDEELSTSLATQSAIEHAYLMHASQNKAKKSQQRMQLMSTGQVNSRISAIITDPRAAWKIAPDSLGRLAGADVVLKVRMVHTRYMSEGLAKGINTGTAIFDALVNTSSNGWSFTPKVKAFGVNYELSLIDTKTGTVISSYANKPEDDRNGNTIAKSNEQMIKHAAVYAMQ